MMARRLNDALRPCSPDPGAKPGAGCRVGDTPRCSPRRRSGGDDHRGGLGAGDHRGRSRHSGGSDSGRGAARGRRHLGTTVPPYRPRPAGDADVVGPAAASADAGITAPPADTSTSSAVAARNDRPSLAKGPDGRSENPASYVVQPGDNLWKIAEGHLAIVTGRSEDDLTTAESRALLGRLVDHARGHLRSGDPDLIYPGEQLTLPPSL